MCVMRFRRFDSLPAHYRLVHLFPTGLCPTHAAHSQTGQGFAMTIGKGQTIQGLEDGVVGMKAGEQRVLQIPAGPLSEPLKQDLEVTVTFERKSGLMKFFNGN